MIIAVLFLFCLCCEGFRINAPTAWMKAYKKQTSSLLFSEEKVDLIGDVCKVARNNRFDDE
jgi:hypothetical protein